MPSSETAKLIAELSLKDKLSGGVNKALGSVGKLEKGFGRVGKGAGQVAGGMARAGTIIAGATVAGFGAAAKAAIDWEDAFAGVVKTVDETDLSKAGLTFRDLELSLRKMSTTMPVTAADLAGIAEAGGAMGVAGKDIEEFTRVVAILGSTTNVAAGDAATALGQMANIIGLQAGEFDNFASALVDLGNKGNSTEAQILEIARRSGGAAKLIGIAKDQTLGWAAAAANLGLNEELAGTALQNFFLKTQKAITANGADLKDLARISGKTTKQFKKDFDKNATGALTSFLKGLGKMSKDKRLTAIENIFGKGSGLTRLVVGLADSMDTNLTPSLRDGTKAWKDNTAAQAEFDKRNATVRSGITRLKNSVLDAAITVGEGFAPALGRAASKLAEFLAQDVNRSALKGIGEDIGKAIDGIDWNDVLRGAREFVGIMKSALSFAKLLFDAVNALPTEIKAAGLGFIGLNKLSGGLISQGLGNIVGGLTQTIVRSLGSQLPGLAGKAFVQPVFVTNMPVGGLGGGIGGAAGAVGAAGAIGTGFAAAAIGAAVGTTIVSTLPYALKNIDLGKKGLNQAEIAAIKYYQSSIAEQQTAAKRLGFIPSRADFNSGMAKLKAASEGTTHSVQDSKARTVAGQAAIRAATQNVSRDVARHGNATAQAARQAGVVAKSGGIAAAHAINRKKWAVNVRTAVTVNARLAARDAKTKLTFQQKAAEFG